MTARTATALIASLALAGCGSVADAAPEPEGVEMSVFRVPSRHGLAPRGDEPDLDVDPAATSTVLMPPDVVAAPGEEPEAALVRALGARGEAPAWRESP